MKRPNPTDKKYKLDNGKFHDMKYDRDLASYCDYLEKENKALNIDLVSNCDDSKHQHHKDLEECVGRLLDSIDKGKVSQRAIIGLRILTNR